ncbi:PTS glucose transporter subunit IIBC [Pseudoflavonifractor sp. SW1122]|uniref:N-acetylglucosamine-specific PTS transporter subunit IIBC n=1 Tax=Pseudoflavonifractor sp. SW1122 TaxID=2530044 RepID=UPI0014387800|nr:PTS glucose transporter subunit IIBC [Pseudoflavonifractor sp. SW1122]
MMRFLQRLGKALMLPVATLPICGILMGIGYALSPHAMQGGTIEGALEIIGFFLIKAGGALIDNMAILFAIGVGVGMADDKDGTAGLAALASWLMITSLLNTNVVATIAPHMLPLNAEGVIDTTSTNYIAFSKIANPFIGILSGLIGGLSYNKFKNTKLPDWLSFFSGKRCVAIVAGLISIVVSAILLFVWPVIFGALVALGKGIASMGAVGAGLYAFFNRLLIPTGLHHALNNVFWFDTIGLGDLTNFWGGKTSADVSWSLGMYMSGFFPCMMFGVPAAALAMYHTAKPEKRKVAMGILLSAAIASFVCGVTEPFEFAFMFLAPGLYVVYALLYGIFVAVTTVVGFRAGFSFSAGLTDLIFSASLPAAQKTLLIIPLGIAAAIVFYVVFRFAIVKFNLKTPGREDDDPDEVSDGALANNDYTAIAKAVLEGLGGVSNVTSVDNCITRLRLEVKDSSLVNEKAIKAVSSGVIRPSKTSVQVIIGPKVQFVADEFKKLVK